MPIFIEVVPADDKSKTVIQQTTRELKFDMKIDTLSIQTQS
jgi:hypothetical protein